MLFHVQTHYCDITINLFPKFARPITFIVKDHDMYQIDQDIGSIKFDLDKISKKLKEVDSILVHDIYKNHGIKIVIDPVVSNEFGKPYHECSINIIVLGKDSISYIAVHTSRVSLLPSPKDKSEHRFEFTEMDKLLEFAEDTEKELKKRLEETKNIL
ncbi:MAG: hypothetical protein ACPKPY_07185 [Nitrososphaeraceae archaeon]